MKKKKKIVSLLLASVMGILTIMQTITSFASSNTISVGLNVGASCNYGSYSTRYYTDTTNNNSFAYCVQPSKNSPASGTYTANASSIPGLRAILYFGYGGPGFNDPNYGAKKIFDFSDSEISAKRLPYAYTHTLTALAYYGGDWNAMGSSIQQGMTDLKDSFIDVYNFYVRADSVVPGGFTAYLFSTGSTQTMTTWRYIPTGKLTLTKVSANPTLTDGNSCYSLAGAEFGVYTDSGCTNRIATLTTDSAGNTNTIELDSGMTVYIKEVKAPKGFALSNEVKNVTITSGQTATVTFADIPQSDPVKVVLGKVDKETNANKPQGSASLAGAEFTVKYYSGLYDTDPATQGKSAVRTWVIKTDDDGFCRLDESYKVTGDEFWYRTNGDVTLPVGTITIQESKPPVGYLLNNEVYVRQITSVPNVEMVNTYNQPIIPEQVIRGGVKIAKMDSEKGKSEAQGSATLEGTKIDIISLNENTVVVDGKEYSKGQVVKTITTDKSGIAQTAVDSLPGGDYKALEQLPPDGYQLEGRIEQNFSITQNGVIVDLTGKDTAICDDVIRGGVKIQKRDLETGKAEAQGSATLEGAAFTVTTLNQNTVIVDGKSYSNGQVVTTITSGEDGIAMTEADTLPRGIYELTEAISPGGYLTEGAKKIRFEIVNDGEIVGLTAEADSIYNQVKRGDLEGIKVADGTQKRLANVPFKITSKTTGESHIIVTDANGQFSTSSSWVPHTQNTNAGTSSEDGIWFGTSAPDDNKGALINDTYIIEEQRCTANEGMKLIPAFEIVIARDNHTVDLGTLTDDMGVRIATVAAEKETGEKTIVEGKKDVTIADMVILSGLETGKKYQLKGWQMVKEENTELLIDGMRVENELTFTASLPSMRKTMEYTFPVKDLGGKDLVTFEELYDVTDPDNPVKVAEHKDIGDSDQTVSIAERVIDIHTSATEKETGQKAVTAGKSVSLVDVVTLDGLEVGTKYQLKGWQMIKEENAELLIDGKRVESEYTFTAKDSHMEIPVEYTFNAKDLGGKNLVTFEELYDLTDKENPVKVAEHKNIEDENQTVSIEKRVIDMHTTAAEKETGQKAVTAGKSVSLVDVVTLDGLEVGTKYQLKGWQMIKEENAELLIDGKRVEGEYTFTAKDSHMEIPVEYTFNAKDLGGKNLVTFEELYDVTDKENPVKIAEHKDIEDSDQTVSITERVISIHTTATDKDTNTKMIETGEKVTIIDMVELNGLEVGTKYQLKGWQMLKDENAELLIDGEKVEKEKTFTAKNPKTLIQMVFTFDSSKLGGKDLVTFEELYDITDPDNPVKVAEHKDIEDEEQTVTVKEKLIPPEIPREGKKPKTGDKSPVEALAVIAAGTGMSLGILAYLKKRSKSQRTGKIGMKTKRP